MGEIPLLQVGVSLWKKPCFTAGVSKKKHHTRLSVQIAWIYLWITF